MSDDIEKLLAKAAKALAAAKANAHNADTAANRAYYAMFNAIRAALATKGLRPKTHSSTISQFAVEYVLTGLVERSFHRWIIDAEQARITADYRIDELISSDEAAGHVARAEIVVETIRQLLAR